MANYGTVAGGDTYFANRLFEKDWSAATAADKQKALDAATADIDRLIFAGVKNAVYVVLQVNPDATAAAIKTAEASQALEFPRNEETTVPADVVTAEYEIAHERLRGRDPQEEIEILAHAADGSGGTRVSYNRGAEPPEHLANGIVSFMAWRLLRPFLAPRESFAVNSTESTELSKIRDLLR